jgi:hypothetical protein
LPMPLTVGNFDGSNMNKSAATHTDEIGNHTHNSLDLRIINHCLFFIY